MNDVRCTATTIQAGKQGACVMVGFLVAADCISTCEWLDDMWLASE